MKNLHLDTLRRRLQILHEILPPKTSAMAVKTAHEIERECFDDGYRAGLATGIDRGKRDERNRRVRAENAAKNECGTCHHFYDSRCLRFDVIVQSHHGTRCQSYQERF